jgi:hypothetical protein
VQYHALCCVVHSHARVYKDTSGVCGNGLVITGPPRLVGVELLAVPLLYAHDEQHPLPILGPRAWMGHLRLKAGGFNGTTGW